MLKFLIIYVVSVIVMVVIDLIWLGGVAKPFFQKHLGYLLAEKTKFAPVILFYLLYIFGLMIFVIVPAITGMVPLGRSVLLGALFGLIAYGTFDLTSHGLIRDWPWQVTVVDMSWGTFITALTTAVAIGIHRLLA